MISFLFWMKSKQNNKSSNNTKSVWKAIVYKDGDNIKIYKLNTNERLINKLDRKKKRFFSTKRGSSQVVASAKKANEEKKRKMNFQLVQNVIFSYNEDETIKKTNNEINNDEEIKDSNVQSVDQFSFDTKDPNTQNYFSRLDQINLDEFDLFEI